jgi:NTE family protein
LKEILAEEVDVDAVRAKEPVRLLLGTTRVSDGTLRIFRTDALTFDVVLASACLPHLHHAVTIDGEAYWDGGYAANRNIKPGQQTHALDAWNGMLRRSTAHIHRSSA